MCEFSQRASIGAQTSCSYAGSFVEVHPRGRRETRRKKKAVTLRVLRFVSPWPGLERFQARCLPHHGCHASTPSSAAPIWSRGTTKVIPFVRLNDGDSNDFALACNHESDLQSVGAPYASHALCDGREQSPESDLIRCPFSYSLNEFGCKRCEESTHRYQGPL